MTRRVTAHPEPPAVELGSLLFTMVEPQRGREVAYNRWYERSTATMPASS